MIPKFRAWDIHNKKMFTNEELIVWNDNVYANDRRKLTVDKLKGWSVSDKYLMQSTGLFDKNGTEIFEGDLLSCDGGMPHIVKFGRWIYEEDLGYKIKNIGFYIDSSYDNTEWFQGIDYENTPIKFEIIGNIYENPELMEGNA